MVFLFAQMLENLGAGMQSTFQTNDSLNELGLVSVFKKHFNYSCFVCYYRLRLLNIIVRF